MAAQDDKTTEWPAAAPGRPLGWVLWVLAGLVHGLALAWLAVVAGEYLAPLVLFPLMVGVVAGATWVGLIRLCQLGNRPIVLTGALLAALATVVGQHYLHYRAACQARQSDWEKFQKARQLHPDLVTGLVAPPPASFAEYLAGEAAAGRTIAYGFVARGWVAWLSWALDGLLTLGAALALVLPAARQPYCRRCASWYHTTRTGRLRPEGAAELAEALGIELPKDLAGARYRLLACNGGCGPTGLTLSWEASGEGPASRHLWLTHQLRDRVVETLDRQVAQSPKTRWDNAHQAPSPPTHGPLANDD